MLLTWVIVTITNSHQLERYFNPPGESSSNDRMDFWPSRICLGLTSYYDKKPLDLYRSLYWHAEFDHAKRIPFAAIYTSLGCRLRNCNFCMINIINRVNNADGVVAATLRYALLSPQFILKQFEQLGDMGAQTVRISDEMFFLDKRYFEPLLNGFGPWIEIQHVGLLSDWYSSETLFGTVQSWHQLVGIGCRGCKPRNPHRDFQKVASRTSISVTW